MFCGITFVVIFMVIRVQCDDLLSLKITTDWFHSYENVSTNVYIPNKAVPGPKQMGHIHFNANNKQFLIYFYPENVFPLPAENGSSQYKNSNHEDTTMVCKGVLVKPWKATAVVKLIDTHLDVTIVSMKDQIVETFVLEPLSKYFNTSDAKLSDLQQKHIYLNIFYKGSNTKSTIYPNYTNSSDGLFYEPSMFDKVFFDNVKPRRKRSVTRKHKACTVHLFSDHRFYQGVGRSSVKITAAEMVYAVTQADVIFRLTDFDGDGEVDNTGLQIVETTVFKSQKESSLPDTRYAESFLTSFSTKNHYGSCLASIFTSTDFHDGVLGISWIASTQHYGGICQEPVYIGRYGQRTVMNYNTNAITNVNFQRTYPAHLLALTTAHEFAHSFGAQHDPVHGFRCGDDNYGGRFLMYPRASSGNEPNNNRMSPCTINYIFPILIRHGFCFKVHVNATCGNGIVEAGEECDCGMRTSCQDIDKCCTPLDVDSDDPDKPCTVRKSKGAFCSPVTALCCMDDCHITPSKPSKLCRIPLSECKIPSYCDGNSYNCPRSMLSHDDYICDQGRKTCLNGECSASVCKLHDLEPCQCLGELTCKVCCTNGTSCNALPNSISGELINRESGSYCARPQGLQGRCNIYAICIESVEDKPSELETWFVGHWPYTLLAIGLLFVVLCLFIMYQTKDRYRVFGYLYSRMFRVNNEAVHVRTSILSHESRVGRQMYQNALYVASTNSITSFNSITSRRQAV